MASSSTVKLILDVDESNAKTSLNGLKDNVVGLGGAIAGLAVSGKIITDIGKEAINLGLSFEQSFAKVSTLFGDVAVDTDNLKSKILELSNTTGIASTELSEGLYSALSAGIPVTEDMTEAMDFLKSSTMLATAGFTTTEKAVDIATTVLNSYGLEVGKTDDVMNTLIETQNAGKTTVDELASSLGKAIPTASTLGVNFEELSASMAVLTANGISTAESTTKLKALFVELNDSGSTINKLFQEISGQTFAEFIKNGGDLQSGLQDIKRQLDKNGETWGDYLSSVESVDAATILMKDNGVKLSETYNRMTDDTKELSNAYEDMQTPAQDIARITEGMKNALTELGMSILDTVAPALEYLGDNIDWLGPVVLDVTLALSGLVAVMSTVKIVTTFANGLKTLGATATETGGSIAKLGSSIVTKLANPWTIALLGMAVVAYVFRDDIAVVARDVSESFKDMTTGMTESQREFSKEVEGINKTLGEKLLDIVESNGEKVKNGEITSEEARVNIARDSAKARLEAEEEYNKKFAELQEKRYAEEEVRNAKQAGRKTELLDASEANLLKLRESYDEKTKALAEANTAWESETDAKKKEEKLKNLESLNAELLDIESKADDELLILKTGNRAKDEEGFKSYTDKIKSQLGDMTEAERSNYDERAKEGAKFRDGEFSAVATNDARTLESFKTTSDDLVDLTRWSTGQQLAIITDASGNQLKVRQTATGEIIAEARDANGAIIEMTDKQKSQLSELETKSWAELKVISSTGSNDITSGMDEMWSGILSSADTSNKKLNAKAVESGTILAKEWRKNGMITVDEYDAKISQLGTVTDKAIADANDAKDVTVGTDNAEFKSFVDMIPKETRDKISEANKSEKVGVKGLYKMINTLKDVVNYNPPAVKVPVNYDKAIAGSYVPAGASGTPSKHALGAIVSGTEYAMIGEGGPELVLPLNQQGAQFMEQLIPQGKSEGGGATINIGSIHGMKDANDVADTLDKKFGKKIRKRGR